MDFNEKNSRWIKIINSTLDNYAQEKEVPQRSIYRAMRYSLMAGGKRIRPVLALAVCELLGGREESVLPFACAVEMIHTYSLIHDDLPAMDNDDYRRGRLTSHKVFGEGMAILAGDGLLNCAFELMIGSMLADRHESGCKLKAMDIIAKAAGVSGMIGGQVVDMESEGRQISDELLEYMHRCKTGALIKASVMSSAVLCGAAEEEYLCLEKFSENLGLSFQIKDDLLDVEGTLEEMGKEKGSDAARGKTTFVTLYGPGRSGEMLLDATGRAIESLKIFGERACFLIELAKRLAQRTK
jgi:geranylgeranyl diphosphate synthase type II